MTSELARYRRRLVAAVVLGTSLVAAGCGVKGDLEPPPDADPATVQDPAPRTPPPDGTRPDRPFVLDGLLL